MGERLEGAREAELVEGADFGVDDPEGHVVAETLTDDGGPESAKIGGVSEIDVAAFVEAIVEFGCQEAIDKVFAVGSGEFFGVFPNRLEDTKASPGWLAVGREVDIGTVVFLANFKVLVDVAEERCMFF